MTVTDAAGIPREGAGVPTGGQFAAVQKPESTATLTAPERRYTIWGEEGDHSAADVLDIFSEKCGDAFNEERVDMLWEDTDYAQGPEAVIAKVLQNAREYDIDIEGIVGVPHIVPNAAERRAIAADRLVHAKATIANAERVADGAQLDLVREDFLKVYPDAESVVLFFKDGSGPPAPVQVNGANGILATNELNDGNDQLDPNLQASARRDIRGMRHPLTVLDQTTPEGENLFRLALR